jgi:adenylosuccinate synthase
MVIGANYGDEGKGQTVNYLCEQHNGNKIVVLTNGSAQRGHTVIHNGKRHVFRHFGSGLISDADNFYSKDFIVNPLIFKKEEELMLDKIMRTRCFVHKDCKVALPYDMFVNQVIELSRTDKHGSCGCGVWETIQRYEHMSSLTIGELSQLNEKDMRKYLSRCRFYSHNRIHKLIKEEKLDTKVLENYESLFESRTIGICEDIIEHFLNNVKIVNDCSFLNNYETVVFENGQGLLLDKRIDKKLSTPSITGCENILTTLNDGFNIGDIKPEIYYVTRTYITRHGSSDFKEKCDMSEINDKMVDETNQPNEFQGALMYGKLNYQELYDRVKKDIELLDIPVEFGLSVTHTDDYPWLETEKPIGNLWLKFPDGNI